MTNIIEILKPLADAAATNPYVAGGMIIGGILIGVVEGVRRWRRRKAKALVSLLFFLLLAMPALAFDVIQLAVPAGAHEAAWRDALAAWYQGKTEVVVEYGRIDVLTRWSAIELDYLDKYHESLGQALHYADETGRQGVAALILESRDEVASQNEKLLWIEKFMRRHDVTLIVLIRKD